MFYIFEIPKQSAIFIWGDIHKQCWHEVVLQIQTFVLNIRNSLTGITLIACMPQFSVAASILELGVQRMPSRRGYLPSSSAASCNLGLFCVSKTLYRRSPNFVIFGTKMVSRNLGITNFETLLVLNPKLGPKFF